MVPRGDVIQYASHQLQSRDSGSEYSPTQFSEEAPCFEVKLSNQRTSCCLLASTKVALAVAAKNQDDPAFQLAVRVALEERSGRI